MKKVLFLLMILALCMGAALAETSGTCGDNVTWTLSDEGDLTISGTGAMTDYSSQRSVPWAADSSWIRTATIGEGVTTVGSYAFSNCQQLNSVTLPDGLTAIGGSAFESCGCLTSIDLPDTVTSIGGYCFRRSGLTSIAVPGGVTRIGFSTFNSCAYLTEVTLPQGLTSIGDSAFSGCSALTQIVIPETVTQLESYALAFSGLTSIEIPSGVTTLPGNLFEKCTSLVSATLPNTITFIGAGAFSSCTSLVSVNIPDSVTRIGQRAFYNCPSLSGVIIPRSVFTIDSEAFNVCDEDAPLRVYKNSSAYRWLVNNEVPYDVIHTPVTSGVSSDGLTWAVCDDGELVISGTGAMKDYEAYTTPWYGKMWSITGVTVENGVTRIGQNAFTGLREMTSLVMANSVTEIREQGFSDTKLTSVKLSRNLTEIRPGLFDGCAALTSLVIPEGVTSIGSYAFRDCEKLKLNALPSTLTSIGDHAFENSGILKFSLPVTLTTLGESAFENCTSLYEVYISGDQLTISAGAFRGCSALYSLTIDEDVIGIGEEAFYGCDQISSLPLPASLRSIGSRAFTSMVISPVIPEGLTAMADDAFYQYARPILRTMDSDGARAVARAGCSFRLLDDDRFRYRFIVDGEGQIVGLGVGSYNSGDGTVMIPDGATRIEPSGFSYSRAQRFILPETVTSIGEGAFRGASKLVGINIPSGVTAIPADAFAGCAALTALTIPETVTSIGEGAFDDTPSLILTVMKNSAAHVWAKENDKAHIVLTVCDVNGVGHIAQGDAAVAPTCTTTGLTAGSHCSVCDTVLTAQEIIPALGHTEVVDSAVAPTCTSAGLTEGSHCSVCGEVFVSQHALAMLEHVPVTDPAVEETLDHAGLTEGSHCSACGGILVEQEIIPQIEEFVSLTMAPGSLSMMPGTTAHLQAIARTEHQTHVNRFVTFTSSDESVVTVDADGMARLLDFGTATITAVSYNGLTAVCRVSGRAEPLHMTLPDSVKEVEEEAFRGAGVEWVTLSEGVGRIGAYAFADSDSLMRVDIPAGLSAEDIDATAFSGSSRVQLYVKECATYLALRANCAAVLTEDSTGHSFTDEVVPPAIAEQGYTVHTCRMCGFTRIDTYTEALPIPEMTLTSVDLSGDFTCGEPITVTATATGYKLKYSYTIYDLNGKVLDQKPDSEENSWTFVADTLDTRYVQVQVTDGKKTLTMKSKRFAPKTSLFSVAYSLAKSEFGEPTLTLPASPERAGDQYRVIFYEEEALYRLVAPSGFTAEWHGVNRKDAYYFLKLFTGQYSTHGAGNALKLSYYYMKKGERKAIEAGSLSEAQKVAPTFETLWKDGYIDEPVVYTLNVPIPSSVVNFVWYDLVPNDYDPNADYLFGVYDSKGKLVTWTDSRYISFGFSANYDDIYHILLIKQVGPVREFGKSSGTFYVRPCAYDTLVTLITKQYGASNSATPKDPNSQRDVVLTVLDQGNGTAIVRVEGSTGIREWTKIPDTQGLVYVDAACQNFTYFSSNTPFKIIHRFGGQTYVIDTAAKAAEVHQAISDVLGK